MKVKQVKYTGIASVATVELDRKNYEFTRDGMTEVTNAAAEELAAHGDTRFEIYEEDGITPFAQTEGDSEEGSEGTDPEEPTDNGDDSDEDQPTE